MAHAGGAPSKLTPEIIEDVRRLLPTVLYMETVGDYLGVERTTWRKWLKRGRAEANRLKNPRAKARPKEALYLEFFHTYKKGLAEGEIYDLGIIKKAATGSGDTPGQWQAAAWRAERRFPDRWGRKDRHRMELAGKQGVVLQIVEEEVDAPSSDEKGSAHEAPDGVLPG
jgi:hypothetical protein